MVRLLFFAGLAVAALMFAFESFKQILFPHITLWRSHALTISFTAILAMVTAYAVGWRLDQLNRKLEGDIQERERIGKALRRSEAKYRSLFERNKAGVFRSAADGRFLDCNEAFAQLFGYTREELLALPAHVLYPGGKEEREARRAQFRKTPQELDMEMCYRRKDGSLVWIIQNVSLVQDEEDGDVTEGTMVDTTERHLLEERLRQSQKMEAIGKLAGGVAHDFNNLLTVIQGYSRMVFERSRKDAETCEQVRRIEGAAEKAAALTRQLLAFSRKQVLQPRVLNLNGLVQDLDSMLRRLIGEDIELLTSTPANLRPVKADPSQLEQIIMNLVVNARDAMPKGGKLTLETANADLDERYAAEHPGVTPGEYVMLAVSDTGTGMSRETQAHIFEPFFTTKEMGRGTGLGLSTVYGIVQQSGGHIWVYSEVDHGTTFKIYFPRSAEALEVAAGAPSTASASHGSEVILLVEDDDLVRNLTREILSACGYTVLAPENVKVARALGEAQGAKIQLLLTDVIMPTMNGRELAQALLARHPGMKVLYMSGYAENAIVHHGVLDEGTYFLEKPFTPSALAAKVREVLDQRSN
jgi:PAS domain S-box-containing protein